MDPIGTGGAAGGFGGGGGGSTYENWDTGASSGLGTNGGFGGGRGLGLYGGGGAGLGGAIFVKRGSLVLRNVSFAGSSAFQGTSSGAAATAGQGLGGAIFICTSTQDVGCSAGIDEANSSGVTFSGGSATTAQPDLFWTEASGGENSTAGITDAAAPCGPGIALPIGQWQMLALPCQPVAGPANVANVLGNGPTANLVGANYGSSGWLMYDLPLTASAYRVLTKPSALRSGAGYWIKTLAAPVGGKLAVTGSATPVTTGLTGCQSANGCVVVPVRAGSDPTGYKLIGNPFPYDVDWSKVRVRVNGSTIYTPSEAAAANVLSNQIWIWNGNTFEYWSDALSSPGNLQYFKAFWVKVLPGATDQTIELLIPAEASTLQLGALPTGFAAPLAAAPARPWYLAWLDALIPSAAAADLPAGAWVVQLKVDAPKTGWKAQARLGQWPDAEPGYDPADLSAMAPFATPYLTLVYPQPAWGPRKGDYGTDFRPADGWPGTWNLELRTAPVGSQVVLHWTGDPAILARSRLTDRQTGKVINANDPAYANGYPLTLTTKVRSLTWDYLGN
ncbi:hypothetical protein THSYN_16160 [Candidatus Thiodictyon syntrophicum]|uniref:Uncharacterized protein n=2 Tax=Candidatus Thiodictyon syntrophicum TaxID=1166950 RepID=A0A2K8UA89_9GAMM|nr:hypothetical protein THSYN_16160 [Candidatus Thiodictyon syntrophicum]